MDDVRQSWSVWPWTRYDDVEGRPGVHGASIHDSRKQLTYRATVDYDGVLNHLEIELDGYIDEARLARLRSVPRERIEATVVAFIRDLTPDTIQFVPEGGLMTGERSGFDGRPSYEEVARLMKGGRNRGDLATYYFPDRDPKKAVRTVDRWIARARAEHPDLAPRAATGKGYRAPKTTDGK